MLRSDGTCKVGIAHCLTAMHLFKIVSLLTVALALPLQISAAKTPNDLCSMSRPVGISSVFPAEKSIQASVSSVGADFRFEPSIKVDRESFQLVLDGVNVTSKSRFSGTRDNPPSQVMIAHTPKHTGIGPHKAKILFRTIEGSSYCYTWDFHVKRP
jgi:hypothetical protein